MNLSGMLSNDDIILGLAERIQNKYPQNPRGYCAPMSKELLAALKKYNIQANIVEGLFVLDEPNAGKFITQYDDEYEVPHDWLNVQGKILDISAKMFRKSVHENIPDVVYINFRSPLYIRYKNYGNY